MPGERVKVSVTADGYNPVEQTITAKAGKELRLPIVLKEIVAAAKAPDTPANEPVVKNSGPTPTAKSARVRKGRTARVSKAGRKQQKDNGRKRSRSAATKATKGTGTLFVKAIPYWGRVQVNGETLEDSTPVRKKLPPGKYKVTVSHPPKGLVKSFSVSIKAGKTTTRTVTFD